MTAIHTMPDFSPSLPEEEKAAMKTLCCGRTLQEVRDLAAADPTPDVRTICDEIPGAPLPIETETPTLVVEYKTGDPVKLPSGERGVIQGIDATDLVAAANGGLSPFYRVRHFVPKVTRFSPSQLSRWTGHTRSAAARGTAPDDGSLEARVEEALAFVHTQTGEVATRVELILRGYQKPPIEE